jgi:hypothetical protein
MGANFEGKRFMNQRAMVVLEIEKDGFTYSFSMPIGSPFGAAYDSCFKILEEINSMSKTALEQSRPKEVLEVEKVDA